LIGFNRLVLEGGEYHFALIGLNCLVLEGSEYQLVVVGSIGACPLD
jgi:hypothetical protein